MLTRDKNNPVYESVLAVMQRVLSLLVVQVATCSLPALPYGWRKFGTSGCTLSNQDRSNARWARPSADFFRATNAIFGNIGRVASEEVILELVKCKCLPILLYGLECCPLDKSDVKSLDFAVTRFLMKLFKSVNLDLINECRFCFNFSLPSELLEKRIAKFQKKIRRHWLHNTIFWQNFSQFAQYM